MLQEQVNHWLGYICSHLKSVPLTFLPARKTVQFPLNTIFHLDPDFDQDLWDCWLMGVWCGTPGERPAVADRKNLAYLLALEKPQRWLATGVEPHSTPVTSLRLERML